MKLLSSMNSSPSSVICVRVWEDLSSQPGDVGWLGLTGPNLLPSAKLALSPVSLSSARVFSPSQKPRFFMTGRQSVAFLFGSREAGSLGKSWKVDNGLSLIFAGIDNRLANYPGGTGKSLFGN
jgi:hypothetical protein